MHGKRNIIALAGMVTSLLCGSAFAAPSVAFYYGKNPPIDELHAFNTVVVSPNNGINPQTFNTHHSNAAAHVSVGVNSIEDSTYDQLKPSWVLNGNIGAGHAIIDLANSSWQQYFMDKVIAPLWQQGYREFFLDGLDSYKHIGLSASQQDQQSQALVGLIKKIKQRYPSANLILNRGFDILPQVHNLIGGVAAQSLYQTYYNGAPGGYRAVSTKQSQSLLTDLDKAKKLGVPVIVVDYVNPADRALARADAQKIKKAGFTPWVTDKTISSVGIGSVEVMPRKIIMLYDSRSDKNIMLTPALSDAALPLEYQGYVPRLYDINKPLPQGILAGRVAGVLVWITGNNPVSSEVKQWIMSRVHEKVPVLFVENINMVLNDSSMSRALGLSLVPDSGRVKSLRITKQSKEFGYEVKVFPDRTNFTPIKTSNGDVKLAVQSQEGVTSDSAAITPWGGYVLAPYVLADLPNYSQRWIVNPFGFFRQALRLASIPAPDVTTQYGDRLLLSHIDGDGFTSIVEWNSKMMSGEAMLKMILERYPIPVTVSVIEGELALSQDSELSNRMFDVVKDIFALPWVEIASHSYSHPFSWEKAAQNANVEGGDTAGVRLDIPNYQYNLEREIIGSTDFINKYLAPAGKRVKMFLWTGDTNPQSQAVQLAYNKGLLNMNGGDTRITNDELTLTSITSLGVHKGDYLQVFAPIQNENIYTNLWTGPFYGYQRVIETFNLTDKPIRFKPIDIYYHFYSASKVAAVNALESIYQWALTQPVNPIFTSEYVKKVLDFYHTSIARTDDGWQIVTNGSINELRVPDNVFPNLAASSNVLGYNQVNASNYIHLGGNEVTNLRLDSKVPKQLYLSTLNGKITQYQSQGNGLLMSLDGYLPLRFSLGNSGGCQVSWRGQTIKGRHDTAQITTYKLQVDKAHEVKVQCPV